MPVTAKLSQNFYERFGDDIANELVNWFNMVDDTYRMQLRELNELNFARFDAKIEERFAKSDAKWEARFSKFETDVSLKLATMETAIHREFTLQMQWMLGVWLVQAGAIIGILLTVLRNP